MDEKLSIKGLFGRAIDIDLPETKFHLQASAFEEPLSYIGIYGRVENEEVNEIKEYDILTCNKAFKDEYVYLDNDSFSGLKI